MTPERPAAAAFCLTGAAESAASRRKSSRSSFRTRAGWSTTRTSCGRRSFPSPAKPCRKSARPMKTSPRSALRTSAKPRFSGTARPGSRSITRSSGSAAGPRTTPGSSRSHRRWTSFSAAKQASSSTLTSQAQKSAGFCSTFPVSGSWPSRGSFVLARWIPG